MNGIILCNQSLPAADLHQTCGIPGDMLADLRCSKPATLSPYTPYSFGERNSTTDYLITQIAPLPVAQQLTQLSLSFGEDETLAIAAMVRKLTEYNTGLMGTSASIYVNRMGGFVAAVKDYQDALMAYRGALKSSSLERTLAKQRAQTAFLTMQRHFQLELQIITSQIRARRGPPLTNLDRAINIATSSRSVAKLHVSDQVQAHSLVRFSQHAKFLGNGLAVVDFGSRVGAIHNSYTAGDNWHRDLFIESSSFTVSVITATAVVKAGGAALGFLVVATPVGWAALVVGGAAVVGAAAVGSISMNNAVRDRSGDWYDSIMTALGAR